MTTKALNQLEFQTGLVGRVSGYARASSGDGGREALIKFDNCNAKLVAVLREWAAHGGAGKVLAEVTSGYKKLVISDYISDDEGARLRESKINYLDNAGNAYLDIPPIYVLIQGKKPKGKNLSDKDAKLFTETGLKVILALLANTDMLNASYRQIADCADVSMGTIGWVLRELKNQGFTRHQNNKYEWDNRTRLIKKWVEEFPALKEKYLVGTYYCKHKNWWRNLELQKYEAVFGGEIAAAEDDKKFSPAVGEIYVGKYKQGFLVRDLGLIESDQPKGKFRTRVEVYKKFWGQTGASAANPTLAHPLVSYASLMDSWDPKSRELASQIGQTFLPD